MYLLIGNLDGEAIEFIYWWFGFNVDYDFPVGNFIIPADELHHFSEG